MRDRRIGDRPSRSRGDGPAADERRQAVAGDGGTKRERVERRAGTAQERQQPVLVAQVVQRAVGEGEPAR